MSNPNYKIRDVELQDAASINVLDHRLTEDGRGMVLGPQDVGNVADERARIEAHLQNSGASVELVAVLNDGRVIANAKVCQFPRALCKHVGLIALGVDPEFQGCGVGRAIMFALLESIDSQVFLRLELYVREDNVRAIKLYRSLGFSHEAVRKSFARLSNGTFVNDLIMVKLYGAAA